MVDGMQSRWKGVVSVQNGCILASATGVLNTPENIRPQLLFKITVAKTKAKTQSTLFWNLK